MSEHIQASPGSHLAPAEVAHAERTPGVLHERGGFNFRLIIFVGLGLVAVGIAVHLSVWWLLVHQEIRHAPPPVGESSLALEDARRPLAQRLLDVPPPHLEGIERESSLLILRTGPSEEQRFFVAPTIRVRIKDKSARLFELREGQSVTVTYHVPSGVAGGLGVATAVSSPPHEEAMESAHHLPSASRTITGKVLKVEPRSIAAAREWAEVQMQRYDWADKEHEIARIPVADAMEAVRESKEFRSGRQKKHSGQFTPPLRSNSGRNREGDKP